MQYNAMQGLQAFGAGRQMGTEMRVGNALAEGNMQGAQQAAFRGGNLNTGLALRQQGQQEQASIRNQMAQMNEQQRAEAMQRAEGIARLGVNLMDMPYEQRAQILRSPMFAQQAQASGLDANALANFDPTDENILAAAAPVIELARGGGEVPASVRALQMRAEAGGLQPGTPQYREFMIRGGGRREPMVQVNNNPAGETDPFQNTLAQTEGQIFSGFFEQGQSAARNLRQVSRLEGLLEGAPQGAVGMGQFLAGEIGIETEGLSNLQAADALINTLVPQQRPPGSGVMSDADLALFKRSLPRIINTPQGNRLIIETIRGINEYDLQLGQIAQQAASGDITRQEARERVNALQNPIDRFRDQMGQSDSGGESRSFQVPGYADGTMIQGPDGTRYRVRNGMAEPQ